MSTTDGLEDFASIGNSARTRQGEWAAAFLLAAAVAATLALLFVAGYRFASIWSAFAILAWMFVAGAAQASSE